MDNVSTTPRQRRSVPSQRLLTSPGNRMRSNLSWHAGVLTHAFAITTACALFAGLGLDAITNGYKAHARRPKEFLT